MAWCPYRSNDHKYRSFTRNTCNRLVERLNILFGVSLETYSAIAKTTWKPDLKVGPYAVNSNGETKDRLYAANSIDMLTALKPSLEHDRKQALRLLQLQETKP